MPHGLKGLANVKQLAKETGWDRDTVSKRLELAGLVPNTDDARMKRFNVEEALEVLGYKDAEGEVEAKRRKAIADAEKAELTVQKLKGELVSVVEMRLAAAELIKRLYQRIVRVEPGIIAAKIVGLDELKAEAIIRDQLRQVFDELRSMPEAFLSIEDDPEVIEDGES